MNFIYTILNLIQNNDNDISFRTIKIFLIIFLISNSSRIKNKLSLARYRHYINDCINLKKYIFSF